MILRDWSNFLDIMATSVLIHHDDMVQSGDNHGFLSLQTDHIQLGRSLGPDLLMVRLVLDRKFMEIQQHKRFISMRYSIHSMAQFFQI